MLYDVLASGASGDGKSKDTLIVQQLIERASGAGGGTLVFGPGTYLIGSIRILDNVRLQLDAGAVLLGSPDREDYYLDTSPVPESHPFEKKPSERFQFGLIYAIGAKNIALTGCGTVDGNAGAFVELGSHIWPEGKWRPGVLVCLADCEDVLIEGVTLRMSPTWTLRPIACRRTRIHGIKILNGRNEFHTCNSDGIDPDNCVDMTISDCIIVTGDDSIVIKNTNNKWSTGVTDGITVTNCIMISTCTGLKIGSETFGAFSNIVFSNCAIRDAGNGIGLWMNDGGVIDGWRVDNIVMTLKDRGQPIYVWCHRRTPDSPFGTVRNVVFSNITATAQGGIYVSGPDEKPIESLSIENVDITMTGGPDKKNHENPEQPIFIWAYREATYDIYIRKVNKMVLRNISVQLAKPENPAWGGMMRLNGVDSAVIDGCRGRQAIGSGKPVLHFNDVLEADIRNCVALEGADTFLEIEGKSESVNIMNNDLSRAKKMLDDDMRRGANIYEFGNRLAKE